MKDMRDRLIAGKISGSFFRRTAALAIFLFMTAPALAYSYFYFPDPVAGSPGVYDLLWGTVAFANAYIFPAGTEIAGYDAEGQVRFRSASTGIDNVYLVSAVWSNITNWRIYDPSSMYVWAAVVTTGTTWPGFDGGREIYQLNLERSGDEPLLITPEPTTLLTLSSLAASGAAFFLVKRRRKN